MARIACGELPGNLLGKPGKVAIVGDEDSFDHVWTPRLKAAGADLNLVQRIKDKDGDVLDVYHDADELRRYVKEEKIVLIYFDQLLDNLGVADNNDPKQLRRAVGPLKKMAQDTNVAVLATMHPNKRAGTSFRNRISGSPAFFAIARSSLLLGPHPTKPGFVAAALGPANYATGDVEAMEFCIDGHEYELTKPKRTITTSRIAGIRYTSLTRDAIEAGMDAQSHSRNSKAAMAERRLAEILSDGEWHLAADVQQQLQDEHKLSEREITRATERLRIQKDKTKTYPARALWRAREASE
jgi:hypothetical protein